MLRARALILVVPLLIILAACAAPETSASPSPTRSSSTSASASPKPSGSDSATPQPSESEAAEDDETEPGPDDTPAPLPSTAPAALDWFGLDKNAVTTQCRAAVGEYFAGATIDDLPSRTWREEETVVSFEWIVRGFEDNFDIPATCTLGLEGTSITSVFVTVQDF